MQADAQQEKLPSKCQKALDEIEAGRLLEPDEKQIPLTSAHVLHRCIGPFEIDSNLDKPQPSAFQKQDLSLYAEGPGLPELNIQEVVDKSNGAFVGAVAIQASVVLDKGIQGFEKLQLHHDPFPDPVGNKHSNHARLICTKGQTVCKVIQAQVVGWSVKPPQPNEPATMIGAEKPCE